MDNIRLRDVRTMNGQLKSIMYTVYQQDEFLIGSNITESRM